MLTCFWLVKYSLLAFFPTYHLVATSTAIVELIKEDEEEEQDEEADLEEGSSTEDLLPKQVPAGVGEYGADPAQEDGAMAE